jgi:hypothetical protein
LGIVRYQLDQAGEVVVREEGPAKFICRMLLLPPVATGFGWIVDIHNYLLGTPL